MSAIYQFPAAQKLVEAFAKISSTEDFIIYVAGTDNMLAFCRELLEQYDRDNLTLMAMEVNSLCAAQGILPNLLYSEIRKVLIALNRFHDTSLDHYATLGLKKNASMSEVKKSYRQLSKQHHPDMEQNNNRDTQRFMEIAGAYHAIMAAFNDAAQSDDPKPWRKKNSSLTSNRRFHQKIFFLTIIPFILVLTWISFYAAKKYDEQILLSQMQASPATGTYSEDQEQTPTNTATTPEPSLNDAVIASAPDVIAANPLQLTLEPEPQQEPEKPLISFAKEKIPEFHSSFLSDANPVAVEKQPSPDIAEPVTQLDQKPVAQPLIVDAPEKQSSIWQAAQGEKSGEVDKYEKVDKKQFVQPVQRIVPNKKRLPTPQKQPKQPDPRQVIEAVLTEYVKLYNAKDMESFFALFNENATENGQLQSLLIDRYKSLFAHTEAVALNLGTINWHEYKNGFEARSTFTANYTYKDGRSKEHTGDITFYLTDEKGSLKIQSLEYIFLN